MYRRKRTLRMVLELNRIREALAHTQSALAAVQTRLQVLEAQHPRLEGQLDVLIRMMSLRHSCLPCRKRLHVHVARIPI